MMKRICAWMLAVMLIVSGTAAFASEIQEKLSKVDVRISVYTTYMKELFQDGNKGKITHVGIADINRDYRPELFYILKGKGNVCTFHFIGYADEEVYEFDIEENYIGIAPGKLSLKRMNRIGTSDHIWVLQSTGKNTSKRKETLHNVFTRSGDSLDNELRLRRTWTGSNKQNRYSVLLPNGELTETNKMVYENELDELLYSKHKPAATTHFKNQGVIRKVSSPKTWIGLRKAIASAAEQWKALVPVSN